MLIFKKSIKNSSFIGKKKTKGAKKDSKNQLRSPMPDGGEP
jgi:hypothetical protein